MKNKNILAIDTSDHVCAVAISSDNDILIELSTGNKMNHSKTLMPLIEEAFSKVNFTLSDIDYIFVTNGPGSFTGVRIGVATAKGLAHFKNIPLVAVKTLNNICSFVQEDDSILVPLIDARRGTFYTKFFENSYKNEISEIYHMDILEILDMLKVYNKKIYLIGDNLNTLLKDIVLDENVFIVDITENLNRASSLIKMSSYLLENEENILDYKKIEPFYLKKSQAEREYDEKQKVNND